MISRTFIYEILEINNTVPSAYENFIHIYNKGYRINSAKEDLLKEVILNGL